MSKTMPEFWGSHSPRSVTDSPSSISSPSSDPSTGYMSSRGREDGITSRMYFTDEYSTSSGHDSPSPKRRSDRIREVAKVKMEEVVEFGGRHYSPTPSPADSDSSNQRSPPRTTAIGKRPPTYPPPTSINPAFLTKTPRKPKPKQVISPPRPSRHILTSKEINPDLWERTWPMRVILSPPYQAPRPTLGTAVEEGDVDMAGPGTKGSSINSDEGDDSDDTDCDYSGSSDPYLRGSSLHKPSKKSTNPAVPTFTNIYDEYMHYYEKGVYTGALDGYIVWRSKQARLNNYEFLYRE